MPDSLPIDEILPELVAALAEHRAVVLTAPAGAGKSTRVPPALIEAGLAPKRTSLSKRQAAMLYRRLER